MGMYDTTVADLCSSFYGTVSYLPVEIVGYRPRHTEKYRFSLQAVTPFNCLILDRSFDVKISMDVSNIGTVCSNKSSIISSLFYLQFQDTSLTCTRAGLLRFFPLLWKVLVLEVLWT